MGDEFVALQDTSVILLRDRLRAAREVAENVLRIEERSAWDRYAAAGLSRSGTGGSVKGAAIYIGTLADALLAERRKRFPPPGG